MKLLHQIIRPEVLARSKYHVPELQNVVKLDAMENPYGLPEDIKHELGNRLAEVALNRYPVPSYSHLKQIVCQRLGVPAGFNVMLGNGSDELITLLTVACAKPGAKLLSLTPSFVMYEISAQLSGMQFVGVPLTSGFTLDLPAMLDAIRLHKPALLFIANPNNPTGSWFDEADVLQIIDAMRDIGLVVVDEAYQPFAPGSLMHRLPEFENLVVMRTVSKIGLAGLRLGYMSASESVLGEIEKVRPPYNINVLTTAAAEFLLEHDEIFNAQAEQICIERTRVVRILSNTQGVQCFPTHANFVLIRVENAEQISNSLREHGILVKNASKMHHMLTNCLRVTISSPEENNLFIEALQRALSAQSELP